MKLFQVYVLAGLLAAVASGVRADEEFQVKGSAEKGEAAYKMYCVLCHGETGKGDGLGAAALTPKPRDLSDKTFQAEMSDKHLFTVIKDGGPAVGKSMFMTAWGALLKTDEAVHDVAAYVRTLAKD